jgi:hypothetical protein
MNNDRMYKAGGRSAAGLCISREHKDGSRAGRNERRSRYFAFHEIYDVVLRKTLHQRGKEL